LNTKWKVIKELSSDYNLEVVREYPNILLPWVWLKKLQVRRRSDGFLMGETIEANFGDGLIGFYVYILGDMNHSKRSCGFISNTPHVSNYHNSVAYRTKNLEFFRILLKG